ncbi:MAG: ribonuclease HII [Firmicutes bacterium]|nr:ribonuclease HII [Bacillota bacterium]
MAKLSAAEEQARFIAMSAYEKELWQQGINYIAGLDEAGRGPLAGPVTAAAVILPQDCLIPGLNDSKKLSEKKRLALEKEIKEQALAWSCVNINHQIIDKINILEASRLAMVKAVQKLAVAPQHLLIDAVSLDIAIPQTAIVHGDALSISIAAASIIAKNTRDRLMVLMDAKWPQYGFATHKGYPTAAHKQALRQYGYCPIHRRSFKY